MAEALWRQAGPAARSQLHQHLKLCHRLLTFAASPPAALLADLPGWLELGAQCVGGMCAAVDALSEEGLAER